MRQTRQKTLWLDMIQARQPRRIPNPKPAGLRSLFYHHQLASSSLPALCAKVLAVFQASALALLRPAVGHQGFQGDLVVVP